MSKLDLNQETLKTRLSYCPESGIFTWVKTRYGYLDGRVAGSKTKTGSVQLMLNQYNYGAHRLAWLYMTGSWPVNAIDHINGDPSDNRFCNLRDVNTVVNAQNKRASQKNSLTGFLGVSHNGHKYVAQIGLANKKNKYLGQYETPEEAHQAYLTAKRELHEGCTI